MQDLPDDTLRPRANRLEILVTLENSELGVSDLDRVEHGE